MDRKMKSGFEGKRLLLLGGASQSLKVVNAAKEMGVYVIVADMNPNAVAAKAADETFVCSVLDSERIIRYCMEHQIDGVLNYNIDTAQNTHQAVCEKLGYPCYGSKDTYDSLTDKRLFKKIVTECGMDVIPSYSADDRANIEYPVLVKPAEAAGAMGMTICYDERQLDTAINKAKNASRNGECFIEKFMGGYPDFAVTYYTVNGEPYLTRVGDRYVGKVEDGLNRQCICGTYPSKYIQFYLDNYDEKMKNMIRKIGVQNGPTFFQGFIDGDRIRWYDPAIRFSGGEYELYYRIATGVDLIKATIEFALSGENYIDTEKQQGSYWLNGYRAVQLLIDVGPGTLTRLSGFDEIRKLSEVAVLTQKLEVGNVIKKTGDVKQRLAEIDILMRGTMEELIATVRKVQGMICAEDEYGHNMLVSQFDVKNLMS